MTHSTPHRTHTTRFWPRLGALALGLACCAGNTLAQRLPPEVAAALARAKVPPSAVSLLVTKADGAGPPRLNHRTNVLVNPASVMKLVTTLSLIHI